MNRFNKPPDVIDLTLEDSSDDADDEGGKVTAPQTAKLPPLRKPFHYRSMFISLIPLY